MKMKMKIKVKPVLALVVMVASASFYGWLIDFDRQTEVAGWWGVPLTLCSFIGFVWGVSFLLSWNER